MLVAVVEAKLKVEVEAVNVPKGLKAVPLPFMTQTALPALRVADAPIVNAPLTVVVAMLVSVVLAAAPVPMFKLLNVQLLAPPKLPVPSTSNVPPVRVMVPAPETVPPETVILLVPLSVPLETVKLLAAAKAAPGVQSPLPLKVKL